MSVERGPLWLPPYSEVVPRVNELIVQWHAVTRITPAAAYGSLCLPHTLERASCDQVQPYFSRRSCMTRPWEGPPERRQFYVVVRIVMLDGVRDAHGTLRLGAAPSSSQLRRILIDARPV